jgi:hypothetical protein
MKAKNALLRAPSLLGRDVINHWKVNLDFSTKTFTAEIIDADETTPVPT